MEPNDTWWHDTAKGLIFQYLNNEVNPKAAVFSKMTTKMMNSQNTRIKVFNSTHNSLKEETGDIVKPQLCTITDFFFFFKRVELF